MIDLSICIPTYNRVLHLNNCLNSIKLANKNNLKIEVCVSDNCSEENTEEILSKYKNDLNLRINKNKKSWWTIKYFKICIYGKRRILLASR